ncbi:DHH family phosphoesterase [Paenibacillus dendritiformis]|uniref:DHH family phosphoesterase n=1 Tax=Paenibacillus dendritiformis TaxID=130049 RepID=UPI00387E0B3D
MHNPYLLKNIEHASTRIRKAIHNNERISIFGDPDSDGVNATVIMYNYLNHFTNNVGYFHNQRSTGHGINTSKHLVPEDIDLLIIVDSSSNDVEETKEIASRGIDVIILDHHLVDTVNPYCILVNPQQGGCAYPNKHISGAVVAWKMCQVLDIEFNTKYSEELIDLAAIGLLGDQMNMLEYENRYIVKQGLSNIKNRGVKALLSAFNKEKNKISSTDILYTIVPCLNSTCRLDVMELALSLMIEENPKNIQRLIQDTLKLNEKRKAVQAKHYNELVGLINKDDKCSILINNSVGAGYRGLLAGDLSKVFKKPIMVLAEAENDTYKGSFRSNGYDLKALLNSFPEVISAVGHPQAGGVTFKRKHLNRIQQLLNNQLPTQDDYLEYVLELDLAEIDEDTINSIEDFFKWSGNGFEQGKFKIKDIFILDKRVIGKENNTIKLDCCYSKRISNYPTHALMKFKTHSDYFSDKLISKEIEAVGTLNLNVYTNPRTGKTTKTKQIFVEDYHLVF